MMALSRGLKTYYLFREGPSCGCSATSRSISSVPWVLDSRCENLRLLVLPPALSPHSHPRTRLFMKTNRRQHLAKREGEKARKRKEREGNRKGKEKESEGEKKEGRREEPRRQRGRE